MYSGVHALTWRACPAELESLPGFSLRSFLLVLRMRAKLHQTPPALLFVFDIKLSAPSYRILCHGLHFYAATLLKHLWW
jgi:hypothetical protein